MKILVTGVNGFVGKHLVRAIVNSGHEALGVGREENINTEVSSLLSAYYIADLTHENEVAKLPLESVDSIINLAGLAKAGESFKNPEAYLKVNVEVATVMAQEVLTRKPSVRFI